MVAISFYESFSRAVIAYRSCLDRKHGLRELFTAVDRIFFPDGIIPYDRSWSRYVRLSLVVILLVSGVNLIVTSYGIFAPSNFISYYRVYVRQGIFVCTFIWTARLFTSRLRSVTEGLIYFVILSSNCTVH